MTVGAFVAEADEVEEKMSQLSLSTKVRDEITFLMVSYFLSLP